MTRALLAALLVLGACARIGDPCESDDDCGGDLVCHRTEPAAPSGVCGYPLREAGEVCATTSECGADLFCSNDLPAEVKQRYGECIPVQPEGEPCFRDANCQAGLECAKPAGAETGLCAPPPG